MWCGGGVGGGGGDSSADRCWSIDRTRETGIYGVRTGHTNDARRQDFTPRPQQLCLACLQYRHSTKLAKEMKIECIYC